MVRETVVFCCLLVAGVVSGSEPRAWELPGASFPVVTEQMQPGIGDLTQKLNYNFRQSIAVVGADEVSAQWLNMNNEYLKELNCVGIVVNVESQEQLEALRSYTDIPLFAMSGESLIKYFGNVYPYVVDSSVGMVRQ